MAALLLKIVETAWFAIFDDETEQIGRVGGGFEDLCNLLGIKKQAAKFSFVY